MAGFNIIAQFLAPDTPEAEAIWLISYNNVKFKNHELDTMNRGD
jgi:hypothetical protein